MERRWKLDIRAVTILSLWVIENGGDPSQAGSAAPGTLVQFERQGYFCVDPDSRDSGLVFNRSVTLKSDYQPEKSQPSPGSRT